MRKRGRSTRGDGERKQARIEEAGMEALRVLISEQTAVIAQQAAALVQQAAVIDVG
jgi:hypothetical protein